MALIGHGVRRRAAYREAGSPGTIILASWEGMERKLALDFPV